MSTTINKFNSRKLKLDRLTKKKAEITKTDNLLLDQYLNNLSPVLNTFLCFYFNYPTKLIMQGFQDTGSNEDYIIFEEKLPNQERQEGRNNKK